MEVFRASWAETQEREIEQSNHMEAMMSQSKRGPDTKTRRCSNPHKRRLRVVREARLEKEKLLRGFRE